MKVGLKLIARSHGVILSRASKRRLITISCIVSVLWIVVGMGLVITVSPVVEESLFFLRRTRRASTFQHLELEDPSIQQLRERFPSHVDSVEEIPHPGIAFSGSDRAKILIPNLEFPERLMVPKFWNPDNFGPKGVREFLGEHGQRAMTPREASSIGSLVSGLETIFVSLASYRDSECRPTLESIFERASHPGRIRVVVIDQIEPEDPKCTEPILPCNEDPTQVICKYRHLVDSYEIRSYLMVGPVFARHIAHRMYRNEYFAMQVDAHVRFTQGWDDDIITQWNAAGNEMAVVTTYLTDVSDSIDPRTHLSRRSDRNMMCNLKYESHSVGEKLLVLKSPAKSTPRIKGTPMLHPFWSAGFSFARGHFIVQVPYDPFTPMLFQGEESSIAIRAFSYGYDFYAPERSVAFHIFAKKENVARRQRHKFWEHETLYTGALEKSIERIIGITRMVASSSGLHYFREDEESYGLGAVRQPEKYFRTFGIHPETASVEGHLCTFVQEKMHHQFQPHLRDDAMGIDYNLIDFQFENPYGTVIT